MKKTERERIGEQLLNILAEFAEQDAQASRFGTDTLLYHSEIHLLAFLESHPRLHQAETAQELGLTRGAVSQTVRRLEGKGFLTKRKDPENCRCNLLCLTEKGHTACRHHAALHRRIERRIAGLLAGADEGQLAFLRGFLTQLASLS